MKGIKRKERMYINNLCKIIKHYGTEKQLDMVVEECAELIQAISKFKRKGVECVDNLIEEIADVEIMLTQLKLIFNCKCEVAHIFNEKIKRQLERIENESKL